jgi:hypothetical protein
MSHTKTHPETSLQAKETRLLVVYVTYVEHTRERQEAANAENDREKLLKLSLRDEYKNTQTSKLVSDV